MSQPHNIEATVCVYENRKTGEARAEYLLESMVLGAGDGEWVHVATLEPRMWIQAHWRTDTMTTGQKRAHIQAWHDAMTKADETIQPVIDALALCGEDPITNTVWQLQSDLTRAYASLLDDAFESLAWYAGENDMGRNGMQAGAAGETPPIRTVEDLLWLIELEA